MTRRHWSRWIAWGSLPAVLLGVGLVGALPQGPARSNPPGSPYGDLKDVELQGRLVSLGDVLARKYGANLRGGGESQFALALPEGQIYTLLETAGRRQLVDATMLGKAVSLRARLFPRSMVLEVLGFQPLPEGRIARRYFCDVCTIFADEWGPCPCCGKELELRK